VRVAIVSEFYPRAHDPVLGVWAHRQALAARDAGADVRVLVLHRPVPPRSTRLRDAPRVLRTLAAQPRHVVLDGVDVRYVPFLAPARSRSYGSWGAWAAPTLAGALRRLRAEFPYDLVHAHNAVPAGDAALRARLGAPLVVSVHGADVYFTAPRYPAGARAVRRALGSARLVLANSAGIEDEAQRLGAQHTRVVHLGTDLPAHPAHKAPDPTLVTVGHLVARKRHADVVRALWLLRDSHPRLTWTVVGEGPERPALARLAAELGVLRRIHFTGALAHADAVAAARDGGVFVLPSIDEAFGVAYVEALACGVPAIGLASEGGPAEIAALGPGMLLVPPRDPAALAEAIRTALADPGLAEAARRTASQHFSWERCGRDTVAAYRDALAA
jgi:teichuronic acid biosynthesis glycosyltransferase TuaC